MDGAIFDVTGLVDSREEPSEVEFAERSALPVKHFRFRENPFLDNVNPQFFFRTEAHEDAFIKMRKCIAEHIAVGLTTALSGTGKTLLTQILLTELDPRDYETVLVLSYPGMSKTALLRELATELELTNFPPRTPIHSLMSAIQERVIDLHKQGRDLVIIIDECHFLGVDALQMVRTLSNIELPERKLVTMLLFGEDSFLDKMKKPQYASILNRMFIRARLRPLTSAETEQYIKFRCLVSGGNSAIFGQDIYALVHDMTKGVPRDINRVCHSALFEAARQGARKVGPEHFVGQ